MNEKERVIKISDSYDKISQCGRCGFCQVACPIFRSTGHEGGVARGRLATIRALIERRLDWSPDVEEPLFDCLLCGACTDNCFTAIPTADLVVQARNEYLEKVGKKSIHRLLFDYLLPYPRRLHWAARMAALGKNTGLSNLAKALGLLKIFGRDFPHANDFVDRLPLKPLRVKLKPGTYNGEAQQYHIGYFVGCGVDIIQQQTGLATFDYLKQSAKKVTILDNGCCGLPAWSYGDIPVARKMAEINLNTLSQQNFDFIVTDCSSCASHLKKYPDLFSENREIKNLAEQLIPQLKDLVELMPLFKTLPAETNQKIKVTYHDPCHAVRGQHLSREPREVLRNQPGVEFIELPEADWCCGGAGSYAFSHYQLAQQVMDRKVENIKKTGADTIVTSCPACMMHLSYGIRRHGLNIQVRHISEIVVGH